VALFASLCSHAVSLQVFATVFGELTNDIATIESNFDNSPVQKEKLAVLVRARSAILNPEMGDAEALATLVRLLGENGDYVAVLDESAVNARASVLSDYTALGIRVAELPPSIRTTRARNRFNSLSADAAALGNAQHAAGISQQLAPFGRQLVMATAVAERARVLPRPNVRRNSVRAVVNGRVFAGGGNGRRSPNEFSITEPSQNYRELFCRVVDGRKVITFTIPVLTDAVRYEVAERLASLTYVENILATNAPTIEATNGTFLCRTRKLKFMVFFSVREPDLTLRMVSSESQCHEDCEIDLAAP
jgi:hypothetical protein